ncbi:Origin recognition complex subunit [Fasciola gigantica]|uniref:Origin recognition complex subunit 2 n=1 Tax=Fasciola gigantica TaxID=46835 RepID=A0A504YY38_FASGI|nr:Origin recognition complex subunit [Fasciola gigantica]
MLEYHEDSLNLPNDFDVKKLADLKITDNYEDTSKSPKVNMNKHKSTRCMLLKAFEAQGASEKCETAKTFQSSSRHKRVEANETENHPTKIITPMEAVESYFLQHSTKAGHGKTSSRTLSSLCTDGNHRLPDPLTFEQFVEKWKPKHSKITDRLLDDVQKNLFPQWPFYLHEGYNILLYGVGSKRGILDTFREEYLVDCNSIVIPGYDSTVNIRKILNVITHEFLQMSEQCRNPAEQIELISKMLSKKEASKAPLYLLLHNIDGPGLRNAKAQSVLARLAAIDNLHLLASVDHINTPVLWSHNEMARFSWIWENCTTLADYKTEANYVNSSFLQNLLGGSSGSLGFGMGVSGGKLSSLRQVAASLTQNARDIFRMIAEHQLNAPLHETRGEHVGE